MKSAVKNGVEGRVLPHHQAAANMWDQGGLGYNDISFGVSDALAHAAQRLNARADERILDVATGTGWSARNVARTGAQVTAVDIASELLAAAEALSAHTRPRIVFEQADAERLPFPDGRFDGVISTFGVMFAQNQKQAAAELGRVCRKGGRLSLATWAPGGAVEKFFSVIAKHADTPPPEISPITWGNPDYVAELLGENFELKFEHGTNNAYHDDPQDIWEWYARGFGPVRALINVLDKPRLDAFRNDVDAYHRHYATEAGLHVRREYLIIIGKRRS